MQEIKSFEELFSFQDEKWDETCRNDLMFMRYGYRVINGIVLLIGADAKEFLELVYISRDTYETFTEGEKDYLNHYYGVN